MGPPNNIFVFQDPLSLWCDPFDPFCGIYTDYLEVLLVNLYIIQGKGNILSGATLVGTYGP
jgi:hypothetical protein